MLSYKLITEALVQIALMSSANGGAPAPVSLLSKSLFLSHSRVDQVLACLRNAQMISPVRGPGGGYVVTCDPQEVTIRDMIVLTEPGLIDQVSKRSRGYRAKSPDIESNRIAKRIFDQQDDLDPDYLDLTIQDLAEEAQMSGRFDAKQFFKDLRSTQSKISYLFKEKSAPSLKIENVIGRVPNSVFALAHMAMPSLCWERA